MGIGDEVMVTGLAAKAQVSDPRLVRVLHDGHMRWDAIWDHNPRIARLEDKGDFQILHARTNSLRPYIAGKSDEEWTWREFGPPKGEIYFTQSELEFGQKHAGRLIIEPHIKINASLNKDWGWIRWSKLCYLMNDCGYRYTQLGPPSVSLLDFAEWVETPTIRLAAAVLSYAKLVVTHEGAIHHLAAALGVPCIVIYGGYVSPKVTGYECQVNLFTGDGLGCGKRVRCEHCKKCMELITPESVLSHIQKLLQKKVAA